MSRAIGLVAITTAQPYSSGRLCTVSSASTAWLPTWLTKAEADSRTCAPRLSGASGIVTPSTVVWVAGACGVVGDCGVAAAGAGFPGCALTIAFSVAAKAARLPDRSAHPAPHAPDRRKSADAPGGSVPGFCAKDGAGTANDDARRKCREQDSVSSRRVRPQMPPPGQRNFQHGSPHRASGN